MCVTPPGPFYGRCLRWMASAVLIRPMEHRLQSSSILLLQDGEAVVLLADLCVDLHCHFLTGHRASSGSPSPQPVVEWGSGARGQGLRLAGSCKSEGTGRSYACYFYHGYTNNPAWGHRVQPLVFRVHTPSGRCYLHLCYPNFLNPCLCLRVFGYMFGLRADKMEQL